MNNMNKIRIALGCDHAGFNLKSIIKEYLEKNDIKFTDFGAYNLQSVDYNEYAHKVCESVNSGEYTFGVLVCGTGIGMSIAANKHKNIRAACCTDSYSTKMTRLHNDANILTLGERVIGAGLALEILSIFLETKFEGGRHAQRVEALNKLI